MTVVVPCDVVEAQKATVAIASNGKPSYLRIGREKSPVFTTSATPFEIGKAACFWKPAGEIKPDVAIIGCGMLLYNALVAAEELSKEGIESCVINSHTIKPIDEEMIIRAAKEAGAVVTVEEHQVSGGLGSAVAEVLSRNYPAPQEYIGVQDKFGESGTADELIKHFGMDADSIKNAVRKVIGRK